MDADLKPPESALRHFGVSAPIFVVETGIATIWKVVRRAGGFAALKVYKGGNMKNERPGFAFLQTLNGCGAANLLGITEGEALLEWLNGPSLGDLTRAGKDLEACAKLVDTANQIHAETRNVACELPDLGSWFDALFQLRLSPRLSQTSANHIQRCKEIAQRLIAAQLDIRPLHGDLHHDNIRLGSRGYCAFDAKGVLGERAFELANAFRNPKGAAETVRDPKRIDHLATSWSRAFNVNRIRLLEWAMVKIALSISWRAGSILEQDDELALISVFAGVLDRG